MRLVLLSSGHRQASRSWSTAWPWDLPQPRKHERSSVLPHSWAVYECLCFLSSPTMGTRNNGWYWADRVETAWNSELPHGGLQLWKASWSHHLCCRRKDQHFVLSKPEISYWLEPHSLSFFLYTHRWVACPGVNACLCNSLRPLSLHPSFLVSLPQTSHCCLSLLPSSLLSPPVSPSFLFYLYPCPCHSPPIQHNSNLPSMPWE